MEIKLLPKSVRETLRSEVNIRSVAKCIAQLVFNSLDAKSASIAIRVNLVTFNIQVIDNGNGISKRNLKLIGFRYATSKYYSVEYLERNPNIFPSRGESLASIIKLSQTVKIISRCPNNSKTFSKVFENGKSVKVSSDKHRTSQGTTIIIDNFMYNLPVRKKSINQNTCLDEIKNEIEYIALMHPRTSFSLRNDSVGEIILHTFRTQFVFQNAAILYGREFTRSLRKICYNDRNFSINGLISIHSHNQNRIQFVYINNRFVTKTKVHTLLNTLMAKSQIIKNKEFKTDSPGVKQKHAAFIINIKCSYSELDIVDYIEPVIEFKNWDNILSCVEDALIQFLKNHNLKEIKEKKNNFLNGSPLTESLPKVRTSQVAGVIRGIPIKRKLVESENNNKCYSLLSIDTEDNRLFDENPPSKKLCTEFSKFDSKKDIFMSQEKEKIKDVDIPTKLHSDALIKELSYRLKQDINPEKTEQSTNRKRKQLKLTRQPKKSTKIVPKEIPAIVNENQENNEKINKDFVSLESNSECGKDIILDKFLKSTVVFRTDEDLKKELSIKSIESYTDKSSPSCIISTLKNYKKTSVTTSTKISITKSVEHNTNINNFENDDHIFKVPTAPAPKKLKRKSSTSDSSDNVSNILAKDTAANNKDRKICENVLFQKNFELDLIKNISGRNNLPSVVTNHVSKMFNNISKEPRNKNCKCTIEITKRMNYLQSSDFLQPAKNFIRKMPAVKYHRYRHHNHVLPIKPKEIVHNSIPKTFPNLKSNFQDTHFKKPKYQVHNFVPKMNYNNLIYLKNKMEPFSSSFKKEISNNFLPIYNIKRNKPKRIQEPKEYDIKKPYCTKGENVYRNPIYFPSPPISFKPYNTNPNFDKLFSKNRFSKPNLCLGYKYPSSNILLNENKTNFNSPYSFIPSFESHLYTKDCSKNDPKFNFLKDTEELFKNARNYFSSCNNQSVLQMFDSKKSESPNEKSSYTFLSKDEEVSKTPLINLKNKNEHKNDKTVFNNYVRNNVNEKQNHSIFSNDKVPVMSSINLKNKNENNANQDNIKTVINYTPNNTNEKSTLNAKKVSEMPFKNLENNEIQKNMTTIFNYTPKKSKIIINKSSENTDKYYDHENITNWIDSSIIHLNIVICNTEFSKSTPQIDNVENIAKENKNIEEYNSNQNNTGLPLPEIEISSSETNNTNNEQNSSAKCSVNYLRITTEVEVHNIMKRESTKISKNAEKAKNDFLFNFDPHIKEIGTHTFPNYVNKDNTTSKILPTNNTKEKLENDKISVLFSSNSSPIISFPKQSWNTYKNQTYPVIQDKSNNKKSEKDSFIMPMSQFSSTSNLVKSNDFSKILNNLHQSILNDTLNITDLEKRNFEETKNGPSDVTHDCRLSQSEKVSNSEGPVFREDSSNLILENYKTIDEILNKSCNNEINKQTNIHENYSEVHNNYETTNNLQSNANSLSKNVEESNEINQNVTESGEYGNQMLEWIKQTSDLGNAYYLNTRTGMTSFGTPKNIDGCLITKRHAFMPKGMSQIMLDTSTAVTKELSPKSKNILHQTIANTESDELQTVKWMNFLGNKDSENFFNELYSNCKNYESEIQNINDYKLPKKIIAGFENYSFSKDDFDNITVINQCDNKFIVTKILIQGKYDLLVLFDQHAVHERIRLEKLLKDYGENDNKLKSIKCNVPIKLTVDNFQIRMLQTYKENFENWGLIYEITDKKDVTFSHIPLCWQSKDDSNVKNNEFCKLETLITTLIQEESNWLRNIKRINVAIPICIQNTIKTEACRTAIKFGDPLTKEQCENLIKELFLCDLPFNCAHGRPTLFPVIDLNNLNDEDEEDAVDLSKLKE